MARVSQFVRYFIWCLAALALLFCLGSLHVFASGLDQLARDMKLGGAPEASLVYDRHNNLVFSFASEDRTNVPLDRVSSRMVSALLTTEDRYFFQHAGMDIIGLARAAWVDLKARSVKQGGSTITQQLIRQVALTTDRNLQRKIKEALLALRVERRFDKNTILEAYLHHD
jgi:membrane carboxypeptidase/penicillin-binding protein